MDSSVKVEIHAEANQEKITEEKQTKNASFNINHMHAVFIENIHQENEQKSSFV